LAKTAQTFHSRAVLFLLKQLKQNSFKTFVSVLFQFHFSCTDSFKSTISEVSGGDASKIRCKHAESRDKRTKNAQCKKFSIGYLRMDIQGGPKRP